MENPLQKLIIFGTYSEPQHHHLFDFFFSLRIVSPAWACENVILFREIFMRYKKGKLKPLFRLVF